MSVRAYAARRKAQGLPGGSHVAVLNAIKGGRLKDSVRAGKIVDADLADREWAANTNYAEAPLAVREAGVARDAPGRAAPELDVVDVLGPEPPEGEGAADAGVMSMKEAARLRLVWQAKREELKFKQEARELVPVRDVDAKLQDVFRVCRTKLLGIPSRARQQMPELTPVQVGLLEGLIREALEALAAGGEP